MRIRGANDRRGRHNPRYRWLAGIINERGYQLGAEIGCDIGTTTMYVLNHCPILSMYAIDSWQRRTVIGKMAGKYEFHPDIHYAEGVFRARMKKFNGRVFILKGLSEIMTEYVQDDSLDFVFIDADHSYEAVRKDILTWSKKVREGGMICGHDVNMEGVQKALKELIPNYKKVNKDNCWEASKEDVNG